MDTFKEFELIPQLLRGIESLGFSKPFPIQEKTIQPLLDGQDLIGQAKTGSGKTAAYGLPLLQSIDRNIRDVQALVLAPTRELAVQITDSLKTLGKYTGLRAVSIYGGQSINVQFEALRRGAHIIVGTPGRTIDHLKRGSLDFGFVKYVVLDEADTMLEMGFIDDVEFILDSTPEKRQTSLFSATMPHKIIDLSSRYMSNPLKILVDSDEPSVDTLDQYFSVLDTEKKFEALLDILQQERDSKMIIFSRTKRGAHKISRELGHQQISAVALHGDLSQRQRDNSMNQFRTNRADILVATDVASRGIDVQDVDSVINYEVPENPLLYFHRVGRAARAGSNGKSYTLVSKREFNDFARICELTKVKIKPMTEEDKKFAFHVTDGGQGRRYGGQGRRYGGNGGQRRRYGSQNFRGNSRPRSNNRRNESDN